MLAMANFIVIFALLFIGSCFAEKGDFLLGAGIADITGPSAEVSMMGYANPAQRGSGIHTRIYSRAFLFGNRDNSSRLVFVNIDACMGAQIVKLEVVKKLEAIYGPHLYTHENVAISGIHTHSAPGGYLQYLLFDITGFGFLQESLDAIVSGVVKSIQMAHDSIRPGNVFVNQGTLKDANINRSPTAYANNPEEERKKYSANVDQTMTVLKLTDTSGEPFAMISWFPVHCTSMNNTNTLVSGDNKGLAAQLFEREVNGDFYVPKKDMFIAAFAQTNEGDVSPNTKGPHCIDTGLPCDVGTSTCNGKNELCIASGPGEDMFESTEIIGRKQFTKAKTLFDSATRRINGSVIFRHQWVDMTKVKLETASGNVSTCKPAMGYSFAAGTTDGPGAFDFRQGTNSTNPFWNAITHLIHKPTTEQVSCQKPKPILLDTGEITFPYSWQPDTVATQLFVVGDLAIIPVPGEFTTMSGRRLRDAVVKRLGTTSKWIPVIAGLSNTYSDYITTYEEYQVQRYEGASTIYGPHTLEAYISIYENLALSISKRSPVSPGIQAPNLKSAQLSFVPPVIFDRSPFGKNFGDVVSDVSSSYSSGDVVSVTFVGAHPRNNLHLDGSFITVEKKMNNGTWDSVFSDYHWETQFIWKRTSTILAESEVTGKWKIPKDQDVGIYRIRYDGDNKHLFGSIDTFHGFSSEFKVTATSV